MKLADENLDFANIKALTAAMASSLKNNELFPEPKDAFMAVPIFKYGELAYVFYLGAKSKAYYGDDDISLAKLVISQGAILFEKEKSLLNATRLMTMGNMISEISHDLRRPLTSIKGGLQIMKQRWPEITESSDLVRNVEDEVLRMNELVRELVDFSNPNKYQTEKIDLRQIVHKAAELVSPDLGKKDVTFEAEFDEVDWTIIVNKNQILEIMLNLFMNAIDALSKGGKLTVPG